MKRVSVDITSRIVVDMPHESDEHDVISDVIESLDGALVTDVRDIGTPQHEILDHEITCVKDV